jgi:ArsR family transcriptional regulator, arsenate/arsenite/antimonite-responsive transcriptional repressor
MAQRDYEKDSEMLKALGHPARLKMVQGLLQGDECNVGKIVRRLKIPQSTASQHLKVLKNTGVIAFRKEGVQVCYRVVNERARKIIDILRA